MDITGPKITFPHAEPPAEGEAIEVASGILWLRLPLPMKLDHVNVYALDDGDSWTIIDTGMHSRRSTAIWERLLDGPLAGKPVGRVVVTHHHPDHIGNAAWLMARDGASLWMTRTAWLYARMLTLDEQDRPTPETLDYYRSTGMEPAIFEARSNERPYNFCDIVAPIPVGFQRLQQDGRVTMAGRSWVVHTGNGHAPEHATFWCEDEDIILAGDQILPGISPNLGVYATEPEADTVADWLESCERFSTMARPGQLVLPGHKLPFQGLPLRLAQLIDNHHSALDRLIKHLATPQTAHDCFQPLYMRRIGEGEYGLALVEAVGHLNHLHQTGKVTRSRREDGAWIYQAQ